MNGVINSYAFEEHILFGQLLSLSKSIWMCVPPHISTTMGRML